MARTKIWRFQPGETRDLGVSMASELDSAAVLTGTPVVTGWTKAKDVYTDASDDFTFANEQTNASEQTADGGETIAVNKGVFFRCTAPTTQGTYYILSECAADDGTRVAREDTMIVSGPAVQG